MIAGDDEDREMREEFGGLWLVGVVLSLCGIATVVTLCQRAARWMRRGSSRAA